MTESNQISRRPRRLAALRVMLRPRAALRLVRALAEENASLDRQLTAAIRATVITMHDLGAALTARRPPGAVRTC